MTRPDPADIGRYSKHCHEDVTRGGKSMPCETTAVAVRIDDEGNPYPVCAHHARGEMVALALLLESAGVVAERDAQIARVRAVVTIVGEDVRFVYGDRVAAYVEESLRQHLAIALGGEEVATDG